MIYGETMGTVPLLEEIQATQLKKDISSWFYVPSWERTCTFDEVNISALKHKKILIFSDKSNLLLSTINWLQVNAIDFEIIENHILHAAQNSSSFDPLKKEELLKLFEDLNKNNILPDHIIYFTYPEYYSNPKDYFSHIMYLLQSIGEVYWNKNITISFISQNTQKIIGYEQVKPENSLLIGPCKVINKEIENINCKLIDVETNIGSYIHADLFSQIISDIMSPIGPRHVAYRGDYRWLPKYQNISIGGSKPGKSLLKRNGCYLITGGLGGIGLAIAEHLGKNWDAKLILISRRELPPKDTKVIEALKRFDVLGIEYIVLQADVANLEQMEKVLEKAYTTFTEINGIIHAAGIAGGGLIQLRTNTHFNAVLSPKVDGVLVLEKLLKEKSLDFFIACSSLSAILGEMGQADYCAANCFIDAAMHRIKDNLGIRAISINWGRWSEVGMAVNKKIENNNNDWVTTSEGLEALERILSNPISQVIVSPYELNDLMKYHENNAID